MAIVVLLGSVLALAGNEDPMNLEQEKYRLMQEVEETNTRIAQMRVQAMEHEAMAKRLQAEAASLELAMHAEVTRRKQALEMAETEIKVEQLFAEARQLREHGHLDEAHDLQAKAEGMAKMLHVRRQEQEERDLQRMDREIGELRAQSEQAEREGHLEDSRHLWERADQLEEELHGRIEDREQQAEMGKMHARMRELEQAMEEAEREGRERALDELREEAEGLEREIHERERAMDMERMEREMHRLREQAEEAEHQDRGDEADRLREEASRLERRLDQGAEGQRDREMRHGEGEPGEPSEQVEHDEDGSLREQINDLREQMADIREAVRDILNRLK